MRPRGLVAAAVLMTVPGCGLATSRGGAQPTGPEVSYGAEATPPAATARQLMSGHWSTLPRAPIVPRGTSVVWTGRELLVWGGVSGDQDQYLHGDGAAYDPTTGRWRVLPPSPLSPREGQAAIWTGHEMVIRGGYDRVGSNAAMHVTGDGAAYDPATDRWRMLPPAPLSPRAQAIAVWTGSEVIILGGVPAVVTDAFPGYGDGAAYDPATDSWQLLPTPVPPAGHQLMWRDAVQADGEMLAWSVWSIFKQTGPNSFTGTGGGDLFSYGEKTGRWNLIPTGSDALPAVEETFWTGRVAVVRGIDYYCGACTGPYVPDATDLYDPTTNTWTRIAADPLAGNAMASAWTGKALFSYDDGFTSGARAARRALSVAPDEMRRWQQSWIGPEHLLMALLRDESSVAGKLVGQLGATDKIRRGLESLLGALGPRRLPPSPPTPPVKQVIATAEQEADRATGTGHLLLALLAAGEGDVARLLSNAGVELAKVREMLPDVIAPGEEAGGDQEDLGPD